MLWPICGRLNSATKKGLTTARRKSLSCNWPERGSNPHGGFPPRDFKSRASANFAIRPDDYSVTALADYGSAESAHGTEKCARRNDGAGVNGFRLSAELDPGIWPCYSPRRKLLRRCFVARVPWTRIGWSLVSRNRNSAASIGMSTLASQRDLQLAGGRYEAPGFLGLAGAGAFPYASGGSCSGNCRSVRS